MTASKPDIVLVMTDQHAARVMGCSGDSIAKTPAIDALAAQGTLFSSCYCSSPLCVPSRMAFLTGLEAHVTGVFTNDDYLPSDIPTIAHAMAAEGYDCRLIGRMHFNGPDQHHGFGKRPIGDIGANWPAGMPPDIGILTKGRGNRGPELEFSGAGETSYQAYDAAVAEHAERELEELIYQRKKHDTPFFAVVSLFNPHPPFIARKRDIAPFKGQVPLPRLSRPEREHPQLDAWRTAGEVDDLSEMAIKKSREAYYALISMVDKIAGRIYDMVADRKNTVCIYTSDHGEALGERGLWWKSTMYDESAKVPLVIRAPDLAINETDTRVTSLMDLSRTLLGWAGADLPGHTGRDLRLKDDWPNQCLVSYYGGLMNIELPLIRHRMIRSGPHKLIWFTDEEPLLFDMEADPDEQQNLADQKESHSVIARLSEVLHAGWDPVTIEREIKTKSARRQVIRKWVTTTNPAEPMRWFDPNPVRNRYEN